MTTSLTSSAPMARGKDQGARRAIHFGMTCGTLATLLLAAAPPAAVADPVPNRIFAECELNTSSQGQQINTVAGLQADILAANPNSPQRDHIVNPVIAYVVIYAIDNDNNGQRIEDGDDQLVGFTGPVICVNPNATDGIEAALQTDDIGNIDILDVQDALILRHTGDDPADEDDANRICHTTDGNTDCFDID